MTKFDKDATIAYLKTLKAGDRLTALRTTRNYTADSLYKVFADGEGDLYVLTDEEYEDYVNISNSYTECVYGLVRDGVFALPSDVGYITIGARSTAATLDEKVAYSVVMNVDEAGYQTLLKLERDSFKAEELAKLHAQLSEIQTKITELEATQ